jgi:hypothetical protein
MVWKKVVVGAWRARQIGESCLWTWLRLGFQPQVWWDGMERCEDMLAEIGKEVWIWL